MSSLLVLNSDLVVEAEHFVIVTEDSPSSLDSASNSNDDFSDLDNLQFLSFQGMDKQGRRILRVVGKFFPAPVVEKTRFKEYVLHKISQESSDSRFVVVYFHTCVQSGENNPGAFTLRWMYEELPKGYKDRMETVYFIHPGLQSRLLLATLGRFFLSERFYWKIIYINRIEFLWDYLKKKELEVPEFVKKHDAELEKRPLMDYGLDVDPMLSAETPYTTPGPIYNRLANQMMI